MRERVPSAMAAVFVWLAAAACGGRGLGPVPIEAGAPCAFCRMTISELRLAAELVAPGEDVRQYDDIGCLVNDLARNRPPSGARAFVADYRSGALIAAGDAAYTRVDSIATPMASHLVAHADDRTRDADTRVGAGARRTVADVFGPAGPPGGSHGR